MNRLALTLSLESQLENVALAGWCIRGLCTGLEVREAWIGDIELCLVEAVTNAMVHAYHGAVGGLVTVQIEVTMDRCLHIQVRDQGTPMTKEQFAISGQGCPEPDPLSLEHLCDSGRGLFLIRSLMDQVDYHSGEAGNVLWMVKRLEQ